MAKENSSSKSSKAYKKSKRPRQKINARNYIPADQATTNQAEQEKADKIAANKQRIQAVKDKMPVIRDTQLPERSPGDYVSPYFNSKEALESSPTAISTDAFHHDVLSDHLSSISRKLNTLINTTPNSQRGQKFGITEELRNRAIKNATLLRVHLTNAQNELKRSFVAHQTGTAQGEVAYHTAHIAYLNAHKHTSDLSKELIRSGLADYMANNEASNTSFGAPTMTPETHHLFASMYVQHLRQSAAEKGVSIRGGVLEDHSPLLFSLKKQPKTGVPVYTDVGKSALERAGIPSSQEAAKARQEAQAQLRVVRGASTKKKIMETSPFAGTVTPEGMRAIESGEPVDLSPTSGAYAGVGSTGYSDLYDMVSAHFKATTGKNWSESPESKWETTLEPHVIRHFNKNNSSSWENLKPEDRPDVFSYAKQHLHPSMTSVDKSPVVAYALKHNLGVGVNKSQVWARSLRTMGMSGMANQVGKLMRNVDYDPSDPDVKAKREEEAAAKGAGASAESLFQHVDATMPTMPDPTPAEPTPEGPHPASAGFEPAEEGMTTPKTSRASRLNAEFGTGGTK